MGDNAVNSGKYSRKEGYSLEAKRAHAVLPEKPEIASDPIGSKGVGIARCQGVREPQKIRIIHIAHAATTESANRGITLSTVNTITMFRNCSFDVEAGVR